MNLLQMGQGTKMNLVPTNNNAQITQLVSTPEIFLANQGEFTMGGGSNFDTDQFLVDPNVNYYKRTEYQDSRTLS